MAIIIIALYFAEKPKKVIKKQLVAVIKQPVISGFN
jgi:hypothetical protein